MTIFPVVTEPPQRGLAREVLLGASCAGWRRAWFVFVFCFSFRIHCKTSSKAQINCACKWPLFYYLPETMRCLLKISWRTLMIGSDFSGDPVLLWSIYLARNSKLHEFCQQGRAMMFKMNSQEWENSSKNGKKETRASHNTFQFAVGQS